MKLTKNETKALEALSIAVCGGDFMPATVTALVGKGLAAAKLSTFGWGKRFYIT